MIVGMLRNTATGRFHPIFFRPAPMPGGVDRNLHARRYKSFVHHTEGFATEEEAIASAKQSCEQAGPDYEFRPISWDWDGEDVPTMVEFFETKQPQET